MRKKGNDDYVSNIYFILSPFGFVFTPFPTCVDILKFLKKLNQVLEFFSWNFQVKQVNFKNNFSIFQNKNFV